MPLSKKALCGYDVYAGCAECSDYAYGSRSDKLIHRNAFNIASMSFDPETIYQAIKKHVPVFQMIFDVDPLKQRIADSWPDSLDDTCAREEWGWKPAYDLESMTVDMLERLREKLK